MAPAREYILLADKRTGTFIQHLSQLYFPTSTKAMRIARRARAMNLAHMLLMPFK